MYFLHFVSSSGNAGGRGTVGEKGSRGPSGDPGPKGSMGLPGNQGDKGSKGFQGEEGSKVSFFLQKQLHSFKREPYNNNSCH